MPPRRRENLRWGQLRRGRSRRVEHSDSEDSVSTGESPPRPRRGHNCNGWQNLCQTGGIGEPLPEDSEESDVVAGPEPPRLYPQSSDEEDELRLRITRRRNATEERMIQALLMTMSPPALTRGYNSVEEESTDGENVEIEEVESSSNGSTYLNTWAASQHRGGRGQPGGRVRRSGMRLVSGFRRGGRRLITPPPPAAPSVPRARGTRMARRSGGLFSPDGQFVFPAQPQTNLVVSTRGGILSIRNLSNPSRGRISHSEGTANSSQLEPSSGAVQGTAQEVGQEGESRDSSSSGDTDMEDAGDMEGASDMENTSNREDANDIEDADMWDATSTEDVSDIDP